jgi:hypothetical protein
LDCDIREYLRGQLVELRQKRDQQCTHHAALSKELAGVTAVIEGLTYAANAIDNVLKELNK